MAGTILTSRGHRICQRRGTSISPRRHPSRRIPRRKPPAAGIYWVAQGYLASCVVRAAPFALLRNSRKTECGAKQFLACLVVRAAPFALLRNSRKTERGAKQFLACLVVRAAPFALLRNSRKTERGAKQFLACLVVRAAPFALLRNSRKTECGAKQFLASFCGARRTLCAFKHVWAARALHNSLSNEVNWRVSRAAAYPPRAPWSPPA